MKYIDWLRNLVGPIDIRTKKNYSSLLWYMNQHSVYVIMDKDENRLSECLRLRKMYEDEDGSECVDGEISFLEFVISFAVRMDRIIHLPSEYFPGEFFYKIIENLGLLDFDDNAEKADNEFKWTDFDILLSDVIHNVEDRTFEKDGKGGLFPLKHPKEDQRKVEFWMQMQAYIMENY